VITSNLKMVREATKKAGKSIDDGARATRDEMMTTLIQLAKAEIVGKRPKRQRATSGQPPMNRTGNLRRSIRGEKYNVGFAKYEAIVGPTMIYGRAVEMGGAPTWTRGQKFPYMSPAYAKFRLIAPRIVQKHMALGGK
jgi:phage gpG-like protein